MIGDWRRTWGQGDFAFGIVQLANWQARQQAAIEPQSWAELRDSQKATLKTRNTGMAVTIDIGDAEDIHPKNKQDVGRRLGLWAQSEVYGKHCVYSGPMYRDMIVKGNQAILQFDHVGGGLVAKGEPLVGFAVAGDDKVFHVAQARIDGKRIVVSSDKVAGPVAVRYGWANNPICNLYNAEGLPASPFRTDDWTREEVKAAGEEKLSEPVVAAPAK
jgi:sialate O-acetylesterase